MGIQGLYRDYIGNYISSSSIWGYKGYTWIMWVVVKIMVPFWIPLIIRHLILRVPI